MGKDNDLLIASRDGNEQAVKKLLTTKKSLLKGSISARFAIRKAPDVNCKDAKNGETPLHNAALNQHLPIVELLLQNGASASLTDNKGCSPLHLAAWNGNHDIAYALITSCTMAPDINAKNVDGDTPLCVASQYGHNFVAKLLLQFKADPTLRNNKDESALDLASLYGRLDTVCCLINSCPDLLLQGSLHHTPLHLSARNGHKDVVRHLLQAGFNINAKTTAGTALHEAALFGKPEVVRLLLASGIDYNETDGSSKTVLEHLEAQRSQSSIVAKQIIEDYVDEVKKRQETNAVAEAGRLMLGRNEQNGVYDAPALYQTVEPEVYHSSSVEGIYDTPSRHYYDDPSCLVDKELQKVTAERTTSPSEQHSTEDGIYDCPRRLTAASDPDQLRGSCTSLSQPPEGKHRSPQAGPCPARDQPGEVLQYEVEPQALLSVPNQPLPSGPSKPPRKKSDKEVKPLLLTDAAQQQSDSMSSVSFSPGEYVALRLPQPWPGHGAGAARQQWQVGVGDSGDGCSGAQLPEQGVRCEASSTCLVTADGCCSVACETEGRPCSASASSATTLASRHDGVGAADIVTDEKPVLTTGSYRLLMGDNTMPVHLGSACDSSFDYSTPAKSMLMDSDGQGSPFCGLRKGSTGLFLQQNQRSRDSRALRRSQRSRTFATLRQRSSLARSMSGSAAMLQQQRQQQQLPLQLDTAEAGATSADPVAKNLESHSIISAEDEYEEWKQIATVVSSYGGRLSVSLSVGNESDFDKLFSEMEHIKGVGDWLAGFGMAQYENVLIANGFDNTDFLGGNILEEADLHMMGITNLDHVTSILSHCCQLTLAAHIGLWSNNNLLEPSSHTTSHVGCIYSSVGEWLESLQLSQYADVFAERGLCTMDQVLQLWELQLSSILGIALRGHQKRILASLKLLKDSLAACPRIWKDDNVNKGGLCGGSGRGQTTERLSKGKATSSPVVIDDVTGQCSLRFDPASVPSAPDDSSVLACDDNAGAVGGTQGVPRLPKRAEKPPSPNLATFVFVPVSPVGREDALTTAQQPVANGFGSSTIRSTGSNDGLASPSLELPRPSQQQQRDTSDKATSAFTEVPSTTSVTDNVQLSLKEASASLSAATVTGSWAPASLDLPIVGLESKLTAQLVSNPDVATIDGDCSTVSGLLPATTPVPRPSADVSAPYCDVTSTTPAKEQRNHGGDASTVATTQALLDHGFPEDAAMSERYEQCQWRHRPELLVKGCVSFSVVYLGTSAMLKADGIEATKDAIDSIKAATSSLPNLPTVILSISYKGVKFINATSKEVVCEHDIGNIYCVSQHADAMNFFAYSTKDHLSRKLYCHIFCVKSVDLAREIILTLGEAFEVAYYASLKSTDAAAAEGSAIDAGRAH